MLFQILWKSFPASPLIYLLPEKKKVWNMVCLLRKQWVSPLIRKNRNWIQSMTSAVPQHHLYHLCTLLHWCWKSPAVSTTSAAQSVVMCHFYVKHVWGNVSLRSGKGFAWLFPRKNFAVTSLSSRQWTFLKGTLSQRAPLPYWHLPHFLPSQTYGRFIKAY